MNRSLETPVSDDYWRALAAGVARLPGRWILVIECGPDREGPYGRLVDVLDRLPHSCIVVRRWAGQFVVVDRLTVPGRDFTCRHTEVADMLKMINGIVRSATPPCDPSNRSSARLPGSSATELTKVDGSKYR